MGTRHRACTVRPSALLAVLLAVSGLAPPSPAAADGAEAVRERITADAELRRIIRGTGLDAGDAARLDRFAERLDLDLDRVRAREGVLPLAAEQALRHARQDLNTLKLRAPQHPEIPYLERELSRAQRRAR